MSATAFQRMRREAAAKAASCAKEEAEEKAVIENGIEDLSAMNATALKIYAKKNGIDIGSSASKANILKKIQQAKE